MRVSRGQLQRRAKRMSKGDVPPQWWVEIETRHSLARFHCPRNVPADYPRRGWARFVGGPYHNQHIFIEWYPDIRLWVEPEGMSRKRQGLLRYIRTHRISEFGTDFIEYVLEGSGLA